MGILKLFVVYLTSHSLCVLWRAGRVNLTTLPQNESVLNQRDSFANMLSGWAGQEGGPPEDLGPIPSTHEAASNYLDLQSQEIWTPLLASSGTTHARSTQTFIHRGKTLLHIKK